MLRRTPLAAVAMAVLAAGCASSGNVPDRTSIDKALRERISHGVRINDADAVPPGVNADDGLTPDEAVALALWNNPAFLVTLDDLGFARADLIEARQIRNPVLSLLFPWGPKQFEATLQLPIDAIWQRPRRVKAAQFDADAMAARLMSDGLGVMAQARTAYLDASAAEARLRLARESAELWGRLRTRRRCQASRGRHQRLRGARRAQRGGDGRRLRSRRGGRSRTRPRAARHGPRAPPCLRPPR